MNILPCLSIWVDLTQRFRQCFHICSLRCLSLSWYVLFFLWNLLLFLIITGRCHPSRHVCLQFSFTFLEAYLTLYLTLYFCLLHIEFNVFSLSIFSNNVSQMQANKSWLHIKYMILYNNKWTDENVKLTWLWKASQLSRIHIQVEEYAKVYINVNIVLKNLGQIFKKILCRKVLSMR